MPRKVKSDTAALVTHHKNEAGLTDNHNLQGREHTYTTMIKSASHIADDPERNRSVRFSELARVANVARIARPQPSNMNARRRNITSNLESTSEDDEDEGGGGEDWLSLLALIAQ